MKPDWSQETAVDMTLYNGAQQLRKSSTYEMPEKRLSSEEQNTQNTQNTQNRWIHGLCPTSTVLFNYITRRSEELSAPIIRVTRIGEL
jgi:hypothetical protein